MKDIYFIILIAIGLKISTIGFDFDFHHIFKHREKYNKQRKEYNDIECQKCKYNRNRVNKKKRTKSYKTFYIGRK